MTDAHWDARDSTAYFGAVQFAILVMTAIPALFLYSAEVSLLKKLALAVGALTFLGLGFKEYRSLLRYTWWYRAYLFGVFPLACAFAYFLAVRYGPKGWSLIAMACLIGGIALDMFGRARRLWSMLRSADGSPPLS